MCIIPPNGRAIPQEYSVHDYKRPIVFCVQNGFLKTLKRLKRDIYEPCA